MLLATSEKSYFLILMCVPLINEHVYLQESEEFEAIRKKHDDEIRNLLHCAAL